MIFHSTTVMSSVNVNLLASCTWLVTIRELGSPCVIVDDRVGGCFGESIPVGYPWVHTLHQNLKTHRTN